MLFYISTNLDQQQQLLGLSPSCCTSLGPLPGTSLESVTMSHWQQQHSPPATTIPHDFVEFRATIAGTAVETENKKQVVESNDNDIVMKGNVWLYAPGKDEVDATVTSKYCKKKIYALVDGDNKEEDGVVVAFDDSNSKNVMFLYASSIDKDASSEDQDSVICYGDQAQREDCTDCNNVGINDEGRTQTSNKSYLTPQLHYFDCYDTEDDIIFVSCVGDLLYPNHYVSSNARKLTLSYVSILNTNLGHKLGQSQSDVELGPDLEFGQSDVERGQSQSDVKLGPEFGRLNVELGQSNIKSTLTDEPPDKPPDINLMFYSDPIPNVTDYCSFCPDTNTHATISLDNPGSGNTYEKLEIDPGSDLDVIAPFNLNAGPGAEFYVNSTVTGNDDEQGTGSSDSEVDNNLDTDNYCAVTGLGNDHSQASITGQTQTTFSWNQVILLHLAILNTIYCFIPKPSAEDYTASSYLNLMLVITTSISQPLLVTLYFLCSCFNFLFWWISTNISTLLPDKTTPLEHKTKLTLLKKNQI